MHRRSFLRTALAGGLAGAAGCLDQFETESVWTGGPIVEDRPDAVYRPAAAEEMGTYATVDLDDGARLSLHYTYPHRFWTVTGEDRTLVEVADGQVLHLMISVWDPETGVVLPRRPNATLLRDGEPVDQYQLWAMLAQRMGYHFGNNVALPADGAYEVRVDLDPLAVRGAGALAGRFGEPVTATVPVEYESSDVLDLDIESVPTERRGERSAFDPMDGMGPPPGRVPPASDLPGRSFGSGQAGDADVVGSLLDDSPAGVDGEGPYLAVSPRTPYNRIALPGCSLTAVLDDSAVALVETVTEELGHHYGAVLDEAPTGAVTVEFDAPPQVARHDGYETAFFAMEPVELSSADGG